MNNVALARTVPDTTVEAEAVILKTLLGTPHAIPDYQREFVWDRKTITQLLEDIRKHSKKFPADSTNQYFLGALMRSPNASPQQISDGQQRLTAVTCIAAALRDYLLQEGHYKEAWEFHNGILRDEATSPPKDRLELHNSGDPLGTDSQVDWAIKPRRVRMFAGKNPATNKKIFPKMKLDTSVTPSRIISDNPIKIMWGECDVEFNKKAALPNGASVTIRGDPSGVPTNTFDIVTGTISNPPPSNEFSACKIFPSDCKDYGTKTTINTKHSGTMSWNEWKSPSGERKATDTYLKAFSFIKNGYNDDTEPLVLDHFKIAIENLNFAVSTFENEDHAIQYFRIFNNPRLSKPLNPGDEMNAWISEVTESVYTDPPNTDPQYNTKVASIKSNWQAVRDKLRVPGEKDQLPNFLNHYILAKYERVSMEKTYDFFAKNRIEPKVKSEGMKDGAKISNRNTWNLDKIKTFSSELKTAAKHYRKIVQPATADHLGSRFKALHAVFKQFPPIMLACMISSDNNCTTATKKKSMNSYALAILENLYVRGMILPRYLPLPDGSESVSANREVYPKITPWSKAIMKATSETDLEDALNSMRDDILGLLNHTSRKESFEMPGPTRQTDIEKLEVIRLKSTPKKPINAETGLILLRLDAWKQGACLPRNPNKLEFQTGTDLTTEHILPQTPILPWGSFTTQPTVNENVQKIGNLMLLPSADNSGLSNKPIEEKFDTDPRSYVIISHTHPKNQLLADAISKSGVPGTRDWSENIVKDRGRDMADWLYESFHDDVLTRNRWK